MVEKQLVITNPSGLHTRPAKKIVDEAKKYECEITILKGDKDGNAKNLIKLMKLGISPGNTITLRCDGSGEQEALDTIGNIILTLSE